MISATVYQNRIEELLKLIFPVDSVKKEWSIWDGAEDGFRRTSTTYAPRLDIAVGPFNITTQNKHEHIQSIQKSSNHDLIQSIIKIGKEENQDWGFNRNPRCLLAVEIEFSGSSKHILKGCIE